MSKWLRPLTVLAAGVFGVAATAYPHAAFVLVPVATYLGGWATSHPADKIDRDALVELAASAARGAASMTQKP